MAKMILKWTNRYSNESGYVLTVKKADGHFNNTFDAAEAKTFSRQCDVKKAMNLLEEMGETADNVFETVEVEA